MLLAHPHTEAFQASLHVDLAGNRLTEGRAITLINRVLSILAWLDDTYAAAMLGSWSGATSAAPIPLRSRDRPMLGHDIWPNSWGPLLDERQRTALALFREAQNLFLLARSPHAVLAYYKIMEFICPSPTERTALMAETAQRLMEGDTLNLWMLKHAAGFEPGDPAAAAKFLYDEGRKAVAHAQKPPFADMDEARDIFKMDAITQWLQRMARDAMERRLDLSLRRWL